MKKTLINLVTAVSIALGSAVPSYAQQTQPDLGRLLAGAATLFVIGKAIDDARDDDDKKKTKTRTVYQPYYAPRYDDDYRYQQPRHSNRKDCLRERRKNGRWVAYYDRDCLKKVERKAKKKARKARNKPKQCLRQRWTSDGWKRYHDRRCLKKHGYRVGRN